MHRRGFLRFLGFAAPSAVVSASPLAIPEKPADKGAIDPGLHSILLKVHADHKYRMSPEEFQTVLAHTSTSALVASHLLCRTQAYIELSNGKRASFPEWCLKGVSQAVAKMLDPCSKDKADGVKIAWLGELGDK